MSQHELGAHYPNTVRLAELYIEKADANKAKSYYDEALRVLDLLEHSPEDEERRSEMLTRLKKSVRGKTS